MRNFFFQCTVTAYIKILKSIRYQGDQVIFAPFATLFGGQSIIPMILPKIERSSDGCELPYRRTEGGLEAMAVAAEVVQNEVRVDGAVDPQDAVSGAVTTRPSKSTTLF